jgi:tetratricopeptide (TPR) repeat protein
VHCIDDAAVELCEKFPKKPFSFIVTLRGGKQVTLASATTEDRTKWVAGIGNAQYGAMFARTKDAVRFLEKCKAAVAPVIAQRQGLPVPPDPADSADASGSGGAPSPAQFESFYHLQATLSGGDVLAVIQALRQESGQLLAASAQQRQAIRDLEAKLAQASAPSTTAAGTSVSVSSVARLEAALQDKDKLLREAAERLVRNQNDANAAQLKIGQMATKIAELERERDSLLRDLRERAGSNSAGMQTLQEAVDGLRSRAEVAEQRLAQALSVLERERAAGLLQQQQHTLQQSQLRQLQEQNQRLSSNGGAVASPPRSGGVVSPRSVAAFNAAPGAADGPSSAPLSPRRGHNGIASPATAALARTAQPAGPETLFEHEWLPHLSEAQRLEAEGNLSDAEQQFAVVLDAKTDRCGSDSIAVAQAHRDLGRVLANQKKFDRAEDQFAASVRIYSAVLGESHPNAACALTDLVAVLRDQGRLADAEAFARRAVEGLRVGVGGSDVLTATALYNLAGLCKRQHKYPEAEKAYADALEVFRAAEAAGMNTAGETADTLYQMGCLFRKRADYLRAGALFNQAADYYLKAYGPTDKRVGEATKRARAMAEKLSAPESAAPAPIGAAAAVARVASVPAAPSAGSTGSSGASGPPGALRMRGNLPPRPWPDAPAPVAGPLQAANPRGGPGAPGPRPATAAAPAPSLSQFRAGAGAAARR